MTDTPTVEQPELERLQKDAGTPHLPTQLTYELRWAVSGKGPRAYDWSDKPHRLLYDACCEIERLAAQQPRPDASVDGLAGEDFDTLFNAAKNAVERLADYCDYQCVQFGSWGEQIVPDIWDRRFKWSRDVAKAFSPLSKSPAALTTRDAVVEAGKALIADVRARYPGEALRCPHMIALDAAIRALAAKEVE